MEMMTCYCQMVCWDCFHGSCTISLFERKRAGCCPPTLACNFVSLLSAIFLILFINIVFLHVEEEVVLVWNTKAAPEKTYGSIYVVFCHYFVVLSFSWLCFIVWMLINLEVPIGSLHIARSELFQAMTRNCFEFSTKIVVWRCHWYACCFPCQGHRR